MRSPSAPDRKKSRREQESFIQVRQLLVMSLLFLSVLGVLAAPIPTSKPSTYPAWWFARGVIAQSLPTNASPSWPTNYPLSDDYVAINQGQLKNFATAAYYELQATSSTNVWSTSYGTNLTTMVTSWNPTNGDAYATVNLGQLKTVAAPFYNVLIQIGYTNNYPWTGTGADDYSVANIGQTKHIFSFDLGLDTDANGLPDWWEIKYFGSLGQGYTSTSSPDGNGLTLLQDYQQGNDPTNYYSQSSATITPTLTIVSGNNQTGASGQFLANSLVIKVQTPSGSIMVNAPISFWVSTGSGQISNSNSGTSLGNWFQTTTDSNGLAQVYFQQPLVANFTSSITAAAGASQVVFSETTPVDNNPPAAMTGITAIAGPTAGEMDVSWVNHADNATYIILEQSTDNINWTTTATINDPTATSYVVTGLTVDQGYWFRVTPANNN